MAATKFYQDCVGRVAVDYVNVTSSVPKLIKDSA
jgi:hypothetical protein